jgi:hypothetical protein
MAISTPPPPVNSHPQRWRVTPPAVILDLMSDGTLPSGAREADRSGAGVGQLTPREMPLPPSQVESEGQADYSGLASAPICERQALTEQQVDYRCLAGRTGITSV